MEISSLAGRILGVFIAPGNVDFGEIAAEVPQTRLVKFAANKYPEGGSALQLLEIPDEGSSWPFSITDVPDVVGYARGKTDVPVSLCTGM